MPALRKLVLLMASPYVYPMLDMTAWKAYAPNVTEIRLWNVDETCCALAWLELITGVFQYRFAFCCCAHKHM